VTRDTIHSISRARDRQWSDGIDLHRVYADGQYRAAWEAQRKLQQPAGFRENFTADQLSDFGKLDNQQRLINPIAQLHLDGRAVLVELVVINAGAHARISNEEHRSVTIPAARLWRYRRRELTKHDLDQIRDVIDIDQLENLRYAFSQLEDEAATWLGAIDAE
jgi:hypothetical protein